MILEGTCGSIRPQAAGTLPFIVGDEHGVVMALHLTSFSSVHESHPAFPAPECWKNSFAFPHYFPFVLLLNLF